MLKAQGELKQNFFSKGPCGRPNELKHNFFLQGPVPNAQQTQKKKKKKFPGTCRRRSRLATFSSESPLHISTPCRTTRTGPKTPEVHKHFSLVAKSMPNPLHTSTPCRTARIVPKTLGAHKVFLLPKLMPKLQTQCTTLSSAPWRTARPMLKPRPPHDFCSA